MNPTPSTPGGISRLSEIVLKDAYRAHFEAAMASCLGPISFRNRKKVEFHEFLALAQISGRIRPFVANLEDSMQLVFALRAPVPVMGADGILQIADEAHLHLCYREEAMKRPQPGHSFVQVLQPSGVWLPNISLPTPTQPGLPVQAICLGASLPARIRVRELILMTYGALTLQAIQMNAFDAAGIMNREASDWWQRNLARIPLTYEPFLPPNS